MQDTNSAATGDEQHVPPTSLKLARLRLSVDRGRDVTQEEMAALVGVSRGKYSGLETGSYPPSKAVARRIGLITGQTIGEVIDEYEQRRHPKAVGE